MTENMKNFIEQAEQNAALKADLENLNKAYDNEEAITQKKDEIIQKTIDIAAKHGITLTIEDFNSAVSEEELATVAGGTGEDGKCICVVAGYGGGLGGYPNVSCICPAIGAGKDETKKKGKRCVCDCFFGGYGPR